MTRVPLFVTGATGFVGGRLLARLAASGRPGVTALCRRPGLVTQPGIQVVIGDLERLDQVEIPAGSVVLHLAAVTGRAPRAEYQRVNVAGTASLLSAIKGRAAGIVFVSSIAAGFPDQRFAWYATSKARAEALVAGSGLPFTIVRPTQVMGDGSPVGAALARIANLPIPLVFGKGQVSVQPIDVDDLVARLVEIVDAPLEGRVIALGGPEVLPIRDLVLRLRDAARPRRRPLSIPIEPLRTLLGLLEPIAGRILPFTAGQLSAFVNDGSARAQA